MYRQQIIDRLDKIYEVPTMLSIATEVERLTNDSRTTAEQIGQVLKNDPALTAKVLKLANSAIFAKSHRVVSINHAVASLGFDKICEMTVTITFLNGFKSKFINYQTFWTHSLAVAFLAVKLNDICHASVNPDRLFTGGILHDIGVILLDNYFTDLYKKVFSIATNKKFELTLVEQSVLGITHSEVGAIMLNKWRIPGQITDIICYHHTPQKAKLVQTDAKLIYLANFIANNRGFDNGTGTFTEHFYDDIFEELGLTIADIPAVIDSVKDEVEKAKQLLRIGGR